MAVCAYSSLMASTGFMLIALAAGARPASTPRMLSRTMAPMAFQNITQKRAATITSD